MTEINRRQFLRGSALVAGAAVLTACTAPAAPATNPPGGDATQPPAALPTTVPPTAVPARDKKWPMGDVARGRTLVYYNNTPTPGIHSPLNAGYNHQNGNAIVWEPSAFYGAHADKTYMWLAESYQYNDKGTELTIKYRKGIKWSDGTPFTTNDIVWAMNKLKTVDGLNRSSYYKTEVDKVEAVDDQTLKIVLNQTDWRFFFKSLTFRFDLGDDTAILPSHIYKDVADAELVNWKFYDINKGWPVTTGAYGVGAVSDQFMNFDLRPSWWALDIGFADKEPDVWRVIQQTFQNDTVAAQMLINDEIDQSLDLRPLVVASLLAQCDHVVTWTGSKPPFGYTDWWPISILV